MHYFIQFRKLLVLNFGQEILTISLCALVCSSLYQNVILLRVSYEERDENHREIKHFPSKTHQEPLWCSCSMRPIIVMKKDNTWAQHSSSLVLNKGIELQHASTFGGKLYCFRHVYGLTMGSELTNAMCCNRRTYERHCATHLRKASSDSHCSSNFATDRTLKKIALVYPLTEIMKHCHTVEST